MSILGEDNRSGSASAKCGIGNQIMPTPHRDRQPCSHRRRIFFSTMNPNPVNIADH
jgi:hypothetical protein